VALLKIQHPNHLQQRLHQKKIQHPNHLQQRLHQKKIQHPNHLQQRLHQKNTTTETLATTLDTTPAPDEPEPEDTTPTPEATEPEDTTPEPLATPPDTTPAPEGPINVDNTNNTDNTDNTGCLKTECRAKQAAGACFTVSPRCEFECYDRDSRDARFCTKVGVGAKCGDATHCFAPSGQCFPVSPPSCINQCYYRTLMDPTICTTQKPILILDLLNEELKCLENNDIYECIGQAFATSDSGLSDSMVAAALVEFKRRQFKFTGEEIKQLGIMLIRTSKGKPFTIAGITIRAHAMGGSSPNSVSLPEGTKVEMPRMTITGAAMVVLSTTNNATESVSALMSVPGSYSPASPPEVTVTFPTDTLEGYSCIQGDIAGNPLASTLQSCTLQSVGGKAACVCSKLTRTATSTSTEYFANVKLQKLTGDGDAESPLGNTLDLDLTDGAAFRPSLAWLVGILPLSLLF